MFQNRFDEMYLTICKEVGGIEGLLGSFFDFMSRKTDFFYESDPGDKMGFPPGYNTKLLLSVFQKFQQEHYKRFPKKSIEQFNKKLEIYKQKEQKKDSSQQQKLKQPLPQIAHTKTQQPQSVTKNSSSVKLQTQQQKVTSQTSTPVNIDLINTYNGGKNEKYAWSQQTREVQMTLEIDPSIKAKQLKVKIQTRHISVKDRNGNVIIEGELYEKIDSSQSVWKIETIKEQKIWNTVFVGDPEIDTTKVNNSKKLNEFDEETQGAIRKIMYEQQRKMQGLPTTDEEKQYQALKQAWDAEGSPFKGTPFDPSKLNLNGFKP